MRYYTITPSTPLSNWVRYFWVLESDGPYCHRSMADGCAEMIFHYKGTFKEITSLVHEVQCEYTGLSGPSQKFRRYSTLTGFGIFGAYLYPFAIPHLFSIPACSLADQLPDLPTLLGAEGRVLEEKMMLASSNRDRTLILTAYLEKKIHEAGDVKQGLITSIKELIDTKGSVPIATLAKQSFLSVRQLERNFKILCGFSPKLYSRILRFQSATQYYRADFDKLTRVAYDCGYYDQSHFIHDFKQFSGYLPQQYFSGKAEGVEWKDCSN